MSRFEFLTQYDKCIQKLLIRGKKLKIETCDAGNLPADSGEASGFLWVALHGMAHSFTESARQNYFKITLMISNHTFPITQT